MALMTGRQRRLRIRKMNLKMPARMTAKRRRHSSSLRRSVGSHHFTMAAAAAAAAVLLSSRTWTKIRTKIRQFV